jgi:hypothetical protein
MTLNALRILSSLVFLAVFSFGSIAAAAEYVGSSTYLNSRGKEQRHVEIPDSPGIVTGCAEIRLFDDRHDGPGNQILIIRKLKRHHRLNVQHVLCAVVGLQAKIHVVLKGNADQIRHRILCFLGQLAMQPPLSPEWVKPGSRGQVLSAGERYLGFSFDIPS